MKKLFMCLKHWQLFHTDLRTWQDLKMYLKILESTFDNFAFLIKFNLTFYITAPSLPIKMKCWLFQYKSFKIFTFEERMMNNYHRIILMGNFDISNGTSGLHNYFHIKHIGKNIAFSIRCSRRKSQSKKSKRKPQRWEM